MPQSHPALTLDCACAATNTARDECRASLVGVPYKDESGETFMRYPPLPCDLSVERLVDRDVPERVQQRRARVKSKWAYSRGRRCKLCPSPIVDHSRTGLCRVCYKRERYVKGVGRRV